MSQAGRALGAVFGAVRSHFALFSIAVVAIVVLNLLLPPLVLSLARKPFDYFSFNPWLHNVPSWFATVDQPFGEKIAFLWGMALAWFISTGSFTPEWGYTVTTADVARWILMGMLFGTYFALWVTRRAQLQAGRLQGVSAASGVGGAFLSMVGFSTMPCSVAGCGAPILPVLGLAFTGLSSGAISLISTVSQTLLWIVLAGVALGVVVLAYQVSGGTPAVSTVPRAGSERPAATG